MANNKGNTYIIDEVEGIAKIELNKMNGEIQKENGGIKKCLMTKKEFQLKRQKL